MKKLVIRDVGLLAVSLRRSGADACYIFSKYIAPTANVVTSLALIAPLNEKASAPMKVVVGDFNTKRADTKQIDQFCDTIEYEQLITEATHSKGKTLNLFSPMHRRHVQRWLIRSAVIIYTGYDYHNI
jgi:hypothetical protein